MKWSEMTYDQQCDALCNLIDPAEELCQDKELLGMITTRKLFAAAKHLLKHHRYAVRVVLSSLEGVPADEFRMNPIALPGKIMEILKNEDFIQLFTSQLPEVGRMYSGAVSVGTETHAPGSPE